MIYQTLLATGALGVLATGLLGLRGGRAHRARSRGRARTRARGQGSESHALVDALLGLFTPLALFSLSLGTGAAGMILQPWVLVPWRLALLALVVGFLFWKLAVEPLQEFVLRFASEPARNLEGTRSTEATVESRFDPSGQGIVRITVDGQLRRVLARLVEGDYRQLKVGDRVLVVDVDTKRNTCRVALL